MSDSDNCSSDGCKISKSENTDKYSPTSKPQQSHASDKAEVTSIQSHATELTSETNNNNTVVTDNVDIHDHSTLSEESNHSVHNSTVSEIQTAPVEEVIPDKPLSQSVPDVSTLSSSEFTHIEPLESHTHLTGPPDDGVKKPKNRKKKRKQNKTPPKPIIPPTPPPTSQTRPEHTCPSSGDTSKATNPDTCSAQILPSPRKFVINDRSKDGDIITDLTPDTPEFNAQKGDFLDSPKDLPVNSNGLLDTNFPADRMNIMGKCRLCNADVKSFNADLHLLECRRIDQNDIDNFAFECAEITNNSYDEIINTIYDYCNYIMHDDDVTYLFSNVSVFSTFLNEIELLLDRKAAKVYKKSEITGQQKHFNILNYNA